MGPEAGWGLVGGESEPHRAVEGGSMWASLHQGSLAGPRQGEAETGRATGSTVPWHLALLVMGLEAVFTQHLVL